MIAADKIPFQFANIFAINLKKRLDRRDRLLLAGQLTGMKFAIVAGIHGEDVANNSLPGDRSNTLSLADIGAWRAHIIVLSA